MRVLLLVLALGIFSGAVQCQEQPEPALRSSLMPTYPPIAATAHIEGDVRASFVVDASGNVISVEIVSGPPLLHRATEETIRSWKFSPARQKSAANNTYHTDFYYRISRRSACDNNRWVTVGMASFHEIEITTDAASVQTSGDSKTSPSSHTGETSPQ
jgi:TonB family protein